MSTSSQTADSIEPDSNISILLKSPPGFGKTIAACSYAIFGDVFLFYWDKAVPIEVLTYFKKYRPDLLPHIHWKSYAANNANEYLNDLSDLVQKQKGRYAALITDSVTTMTSSAVGWSMAFDGSSAVEYKHSDSEQLIAQFDDYKVETGFASRALDLTKGYGGFNIWTAHPFQVMDVKAGSGGNVQSISKVSTLVSYGNKVGQMIPGSFTEIYHFRRQVEKRIVCTDAYGEDYAKTCYNLPKEIDITNKLFAEVWREEVNKGLGGIQNANVNTSVNPFGSPTGKKWKV